MFRLLVLDYFGTAQVGVKVENTPNGVVLSYNFDRCSEYVEQMDAETLYRILAFCEANKDAIGNFNLSHGEECIAFMEDLDDTENPLIIQKFNDCDELHQDSDNFVEFLTERRA